MNKKKRTILPSPSHEEAIETFTTIRDWLRYAMTEMELAGCTYGQGCPDAWCEARWLISGMLRIPHHQIDYFLDSHLTLSERKRLAELLTRRTQAKIPTAYLLKEAWLQGNVFYVDERVIIPRSFLAELLHNTRIGDWLSVPPESITRILDLCTGSGCLAILAALAFPCAKVIATDISRKALEVAAINIEAYGLSDRIELRQGDLFEALGENLNFDVILANPPYVLRESINTLPKEYQYEPRLALNGGKDGMTFVRRIISSFPKYINDNGHLLVEVGNYREKIEPYLTEICASIPVDLLWLSFLNHPSPVFCIRLKGKKGN